MLPRFSAQQCNPSRLGEPTGLSACPCYSPLYPQESFERLLREQPPVSVLSGIRKV